ncbi:MAG: GntR family transcriptional regulator [Candidatus Marinimicrobia bacterium]|nr:GntR family transcriptional regulator [Candidatus Neomarinimicrobiota bacterium]
MSNHFNSTTPIYLQVARQIRDAIVEGDLSEGQAIPSVRQISVERNLNPQTVLNATRLLMDEGILEKQRGIGIFVSAGARKKLLRLERQIFETEDVPALVSRAALLNFSASETNKIITAAFKERK